MVKLNNLKKRNDSEETRALFASIRAEMGEEEFERIADMAVKHMDNQGLSEAFQVGPFLGKDVIKIAEGIEGFIVIPAGTKIQRIDPKPKFRVPVYQFTNYLYQQEGDSFTLEESFIVNVSDVWKGWLQDNQGAIHENRTRLVINSTFARFIYLIDFEQWWSLGGEKLTIDFRQHWQKQEDMLLKNWDKVKDCFTSIIGEFTDVPKDGEGEKPGILKYNLDTMENLTMGRFMATCKAFPGSDGLY